MRWLFSELYSEDMMRERRRRYVEIIKALEGAAPPEAAPS
jgi:hypothetical protein